jgi:hypothetical protein
VSVGVTLRFTICGLVCTVYNISRPFVLSSCNGICFT